MICALAAVIIERIRQTQPIGANQIDSPAKVVNRLLMGMANGLWGGDMQGSTRIGRLKSSLICAVIVSASVVASVPSSAATLTASAADIDNFGMLASTGAPKFTYESYTAGPLATGTFTVAWNRDVLGAQSADVGTASAHNAAAGDVFKLKVYNDNENPWNFQLIINGVEGAVVSIVNQTSQILSYVLGDGPINSFAVRVSGILPINGNDRTAEFSISAVPIPPALLLFASGIAGLSLLGLRRQKKPKLGFTTKV